jgi:hypothetical protein
MATLPFPRPPSLSLPVRPPLLRSRSTGEGGRRPRPGHGSRAEKVASGRRAWGLAAAASHGVDPGQAGPHPHRRRVSMAGRPLPAEAAASTSASGVAGLGSLSRSARQRGPRLPPSLGGGADLAQWLRRRRTRRDPAWARRIHHGSGGSSTGAVAAHARIRQAR